MKKVKLWVVIIVGLSTVGLGCCKKESAQEPAVEEQPTLNFTASRLFANFNVNKTSAEARFKGRLFNIKGEVYDVPYDGGLPVVLLDTGDTITQIRALFHDEFKPQVQALKKGQHVHIHCRCAGYTDLVELVDCSFVKSNPDDASK